MKNGISRLTQKKMSITSAVLIGVTTLAAGLVLLRSIPDLIRYMRARRM
jgi:hypothetical protein